MRPFVIEMVGPPGAGKTTMRDIVLRSLARQGYAARDLRSFSEDLLQRATMKPVDRLLLQVAPQQLKGQVLRRYRGAMGQLLEAKRAEFVQNHQPFFQIADELVRKTAQEIDSWAIDQLGQFAGRYSLATRSHMKLDFILADEGFLQRTLSSVSLLALEQDDDQILPRMLNALPTVDSYVFIGSSFSDLARRMQKRRKGLARRLIGLTNAQQQRLDENFRGAMKTAANWLSDRNFSTDIVDNSHDKRHLSKRADEIVDRLIELSSRPT